MRSLMAAAALAALPLAARAQTTADVRLTEWKVDVFVNRERATRR